MPVLSGTAARSATPAAAPGRTRRRPGSGGSSPPHRVSQAKQLTLDAPISPAREMLSSTFLRLCEAGGYVELSRV